MCWQCTSAGGSRAASLPWDPTGSPPLGSHGTLMVKANPLSSSSRKKVSTCRNSRTSFFCSYSHLIARGIALSFWNLLITFPDLTCFSFPFFFFSPFFRATVLKVRELPSNTRWEMPSQAVLFLHYTWHCLHKHSGFRKSLISTVANLTISLKDQEFQMGRILLTFLFSWYL